MTGSVIGKTNLPGPTLEINFLKHSVICGESDHLGQVVFLHKASIKTPKNINTPLKLTMEPKHHPSEKVKKTSLVRFHVNFARCTMKKYVDLMYV